MRALLLLLVSVPAAATPLEVKKLLPCADAPGDAACACSVRVTHPKKELGRFRALAKEEVFPLAKRLCTTRFPVLGNTRRIIFQGHFAAAPPTHLSVYFTEFSTGHVVARTWQRSSKSPLALGDVVDTERFTEALGSILVTDYPIAPDQPFVLSSAARHRVVLRLDRDTQVRLSAEANVRSADAPRQATRGELPQLIEEGIVVPPEYVRDPVLRAWYADRRL